MNEKKLRRIIRKMIQERRAQKSQSLSLAKVIFEQDEEKAEAAGKVGDAPRGDAIDKTTNVKDVDPVEIANQLLSGDDDSPIVQSTQGEWFATNGAQAKEWIEKIGPEVFVKRLTDLSAKVPASGLSDS